MKYTKVAAAVAGSVAALAAPSAAFAADGPAMPPMSVTGGVTETLSAVAPLSQDLPQHVGNGLAEQNESVDKVVGTVQGVNKVRNNAPGEVLESANLAGQVLPMLGGLHVNGNG
ncbi:hypothetical protein [Streptomyces sp. NPDC012888]|uniref:hypothetical protein n=1 Tax=Streptomyces sp. NPDC012888 TaxID=3364855 RepID=UPI0036C9AB5D